eukprot:s1284_g4.t1
MVLDLCHEFYVSGKENLQWQPENEEHQRHPIQFAAYFGLGCPASQTDDLEYPFVNPYLRLQLLLSQEWLDSGSAPLAFKQGCTADKASQMQRLLSSDKLREVACLARHPYASMSDFYRAPMARLLGAVKELKARRSVQRWKEDWSEDSSGYSLRSGVTERGAWLTQHFATWDLSEQKSALNRIRKQVLSEPTTHLNLQTERGVRNTILVLRFLHDFEGHLDRCNTRTEKEPQAKQEGERDEWANMELFCRPWVIADAETLAAHGMLPAASLAAMVLGQSPRAWRRLHFARLLGPNLFACRVQLDSFYRIDTSLGLGELAKAVSQGQAMSCVQGAIPQLTSRAFHLEEVRSVTQRLTPGHRPRGSLPCVRYAGRRWLAPKVDEAPKPVSKVPKAVPAAVSGLASTSAPVALTSERAHRTTQPTTMASYEGAPV